MEQAPPPVPSALQQLRTNQAVPGWRACGAGGAAVASQHGQQGHRSAPAAAYRAAVGQQQPPHQQQLQQPPGPWQREVPGRWASSSSSAVQQPPCHSVPTWPQHAPPAGQQPTMPAARPQEQRPPDAQWPWQVQAAPSRPLSVGPVAGVGEEARPAPPLEPVWRSSSQPTSQPSPASGLARRHSGPQLTSMQQRSLRELLTTQKPQRTGESQAEELEAQGPPRRHSSGAEGARASWGPLAAPQHAQHMQTKQQYQLAYQPAPLLGPSAQRSSHGPPNPALAIPAAAPAQQGSSCRGAGREMQAVGGPAGQEAAVAPSGRLPAQQPLMPPHYHQHHQQQQQQRRPLMQPHYPQSCPGPAPQLDERRQQPMQQAQQGWQEPPEAHQSHQQGAPAERQHRSVSGATALPMQAPQVHWELLPPAVPPPQQALPAQPVQGVQLEQQQQQHPYQQQQQQQQQRAQAAPAGKRPLRFTLEEWDLPPGVVQAFLDKGVKRMYPWQAAALECGEDGSNLVYCAPTSGGKSLVAEVLMVRQLCRTMVLVGGRWRKPRYGRALVVLPYISIVNEKAEHLARVLQPMQAAVKGYFGAEESGSPLAPRGETVAVCTMEKANVAINKLAQEGRLGELCCVVVDELHMVGDGHRGAGLELALSKLLFSPHAQHIQIVGMSATMGGLEALGAWLRARLFLTNFRPVPLTEHAVFQGTVYEKVAVGKPPKQDKEQQGAGPESGGEDDGPLEKIRDLPPSASRDRDRLVPLVAEVVAEGHSVLVFCATRKYCETCAAMLAELLPQVAPKEPAVEAELVTQRQALLAEMREALGGPAAAELEQCFMQGIAFHHAGLTAEERSGVEKGYRSGCLQVLTATSTLAAGINLPARRVILRSLQQGIGPVARAQYLQMVGRAGRAGQSVVGESFIFGQGPEGGREWRAICALLTAPMPSLQSQILPEAALKVTDLEGGLGEEHTQCLQRLLLEAVANGSVASAQDISALLHCTFAGHQHPYHLVHAAARAALLALSTRGQGKGLLELSQEGQQWCVTHKGRAVYDSALPLELAMQLYDDLKRAEEGVVLGSGLHLLYYCMLEHSGFQIASWSAWHDALERLPQGHKRVAEAVGVSLQFAQMVRAGRRADAEASSRHARFAAALVVNDLMSECPLAEVVAKWGAPNFVTVAGLSRGQMQKLQLDVSKYMGMAALLCETAGWWPLATLYTNMSQIAAAGVRQELLGLMRVPGMNAGRARALYRAGIRDAQALAVSEQGAVEKALAAGLAQQMKGRGSGGAGSGGGGGKAGGKVSGKQQDGGGFAPFAMARRAAEALLRSAREYVVQSTKALTDLAEEIAEEEGLDSSRPGSRMEGAEDELPAAGDERSLQQPAQQQQQQQQQARLSGGRLSGAAARPTAEGGAALSSADIADIRRAVQDAPPTPGAGKDRQHHAVVSIALEAQQTWSKGLARVEHLQPSMPESQLLQFLSLWASQPRFALALFIKPTSAKQQLQALAVCWQSDSVHFLDLSGSHCARELEQGAGGGTLLQRIGAILSRAGSHKLCFNASWQAQLLLQAGLPLAGPVEDPRVASWLLSPEGLEQATLKSLHATMAAKFQVRVPSLPKPGVTATCRAALLTLAVVDPLKRLLAARGMLETFLALEMPAALAAGHVSAAAATCLLPPAALAGAQAAAEAAMGEAVGRLREVYNNGSLDPEDQDTLTSLLSDMRLPQPPRPKRGRPVVSLQHLQLLLGRCRRPMDLEVLQCLIQFKLCRQALQQPLLTLLNGETEEQGQQQQQQPPQAARAGPGPATALAAGAAPGLQLCTLTPSGQPNWGQPQDAALGALLSSHWAALRSAVSMQSVQEELEEGALLPAHLPGTVVAVWATRDQLRPAGAGADPQAPEDPLDPHYSNCQPAGAQKVLVAGTVVELSGKRLCTALDFRQRDSMARVRLACLPAAEAGAGGSRGSGSGGGSIGGIGGSSREPLDIPELVELSCPCSEMWRIAGPAASLWAAQQQEPNSLASGAVPTAERQQEAAPARKGGVRPPAGPPREAQVFPVHGYVTGQAWLLGGRASGAERGRGGELLLCVRLQHLELLALAVLSSDPALLEACGRAAPPAAGGSAGSGSTGDPGEPGPAGPPPTPADPYRHLSNCWATVACQVAAGASADGQHAGVLLTAAAARAVVHALAHGWSHRRLGEELGCGKAQASALAQSFLAAFPALSAWWEASGGEAERRGAVAMLGGRQRAVTVAARADAMARVRAHRAAMHFALAGSVADICKAALVAIHAAVQATPAAVERGVSHGSSNDLLGNGGQEAQVVFAWGASLVVRVQEGSAQATADAVRRALQRLRVGRRELAVAARVSAGRSLHLLSQHMPL